MKPSAILSVLWLSICLSVSAQTQIGYVKTKGRIGSNGIVIHGKPLSGAIVTVKGHNAVVSGSNGKFLLAVPGNNYYLQNVQKQGYVLTDPDVLTKQYIQSNNSLVLVLEEKTRQIDDRLQAERKIRRSLQLKLQEREDEIERLKAQNIITHEEYQQRLIDLNGIRKNNEQLISEMAQQYAKIDYDLLNELNQKICTAILDGNLILADSLLRSKGDINNRIEEVRKEQRLEAQEKRDLAAKQKDLADSRVGTQKKLEDIASDCNNLYKRYVLEEEYDSALYYTELRSTIDTMNIEYQRDAAMHLTHFVTNGIRIYDVKTPILQLLESAVQLNRRCIALQRSVVAKQKEIRNEEELAQSLTRLAFLYSRLISINRLNFTLKKEYSKWVDMNETERNILNAKLETRQYGYGFEVNDSVFSRIGEIAPIISNYLKIHTNVGIEAEHLFKEAMALHQANLPSHTEKTDFKMVSILTFMSHLYYDEEQYEKCENVLKEMLPIYQRLVKKDVGYLTPMARTMFMLGQLYKQINRIKESEKFLKKSIKIYDKVASSDSTKKGYYMPLGMLLDLYANRVYESRQITVYKDLLSYYIKRCRLYPQIYSNHLWFILTHMAIIAGEYANKNLYSKSVFLWNESLDGLRLLADIGSQVTMFAT